MALQNILPDPNHGISHAGIDSTAAYGPGYASVKLSSEQKVLKDRTNGGSLFTRARDYHMWNIDITYNPLTKTDFETIYAFLAQYQASLKPFYVSLPQYRGLSNNLTTGATGTGGDNQLTTNVNGTAPTPGQIFHISDSSNPLHTKTYQITRVETGSTTHDLAPETSPDPSGSQLRLTFLPKLKDTVSSGKSVVLNSPLIRVVLASDINAYTLDSNGLYKYSIRLEEACF